MIRVVIADDEEPARGRLRTFLIDYPDHVIVGEADNGDSAVTMVNDLKPDLLFLDIQMPKGDGFEVLQKLTFAPAVVFTTAYDEYAIEAFNIHALDYLLKPFSKERFQQSIETLQKSMEMPEVKKSKSLEALKEVRLEKEYLKRVSVRNNHVYSILSVDDILTIRTRNGLVFIQTGNKEIQTDTTLNLFEQRLDPSQFMRIHRTAIINLEKIDKIMPWGQGRFAVVMDEGTSLQVSRERLKEFKERVGLRI